MTNTIQNTVDKAVNLKAQIDSLTEHYDLLRKSIELAMRKEGTKLVEGAIGYAKWIDSKAAGRLDEKKIADRLGISDLKEFKTEGKAYSFIKISINASGGDLLK